MSEQSSDMSVDLVERFNGLVAQLGDVLDRFTVTVQGVDAAVERIDAITEEVTEIVDEADRVLVAFSPASIRG